VTTTIRLTALSLAILAPTTTAPGATAAADPPKGDPVPFETLAIVSGTTGIDLTDDQILRLTSTDDVEAVGDLLAEGHDPMLADDVVAAIDEIPPGDVVLIGVIDVSCTPAEAAGLVRLDDGHLAMFAPGHVREPIECFVANVTVAVLGVDAADAPPGAADSAALVHFGFVGSEHPGGLTAVELTDDAGALSAVLGPEADVPALSDPPPGVRRLAFVGSGCQYDTAELWVTQRLVTPQFEHDDPDPVINCAVAEFYLAVFDVPADRLPPTAELDDSIVG
jgi:hypothetical protein